MEKSLANLKILINDFFSYNYPFYIVRNKEWINIYDGRTNSVAVWYLTYPQLRPYANIELWISNDFAFFKIRAFDFFKPQSLEINITLEEFLDLGFDVVYFHWKTLIIHHSDSSIGIKIAVIRKQMEESYVEDKFATLNIT